MERRSIKGNRSLTPYWHRSQGVQALQRLVCPCGALVYEGPAPDFPRVSCPKCKKVMEVPPEFRKKK